MDVSNTRRIVILGKTGSGKSSLANTIFGEGLFTIGHTLKSETRKCESKTKSVNGRSITLIDTPGFFDTEISEEKMKPEIVRCITECAPGPHAFLIVLKVEKFTEHEEAVITKINEYFSEEVYKYAILVFTHGDQLPEGKTIKDLVCQNQLVSDLVEKCGGRCHIVDNKYWKNNRQDEYRSNQFQVKELLNTIEKMIESNKGSCYTNEMLQTVEEVIQQEVEAIRRSSGNMSEEEIREQARFSTFKKFCIRLAGTATGVVLGALLGVVVSVGIVVIILRAVGITVAAAVAAVGETAAVAGVGVSAAVGAVMGGVTGYAEAEGADTPWEAAKRAAEAVKDQALSVYEACDIFDRVKKEKSKQS
ncbi:GTPase IMAP family member 7-like isoform X2 [Perca fluviatilis]|uniref:GTPase IMAP family member 7-like isoform X1 n=1 Tax=Perca fluviatilis TaxID=8168 RepID=UPI0019632D16|nr:GTPase IMAP family member 7-like isoform X1 [Perca fluviatilis]XP_039679502.1 GTPase IMAP family member 7-like isoform X2 [Perca fluviatilis]